MDWDWRQIQERKEEDSIFNLLTTDLNAFHRYIRNFEITDYNTHNNLDTRSVLGLVAFLKKDIYVEKLSLGDGGIMKDGISKYFFWSLICNTKIKELSLNYKKINHPQSLANLLINNKRLTTLRLVSVRFSFEDLEILTSGIRNLKHLEFCMCKLTPTTDIASWKLLLDSLQQNNVLEHLTWSHNGLGDIGANIIGTWLGSNPPLTKLTLLSENIKQLGFNNIIKGLTTNNNLISLELSGVGSVCLNKLFDLLQTANSNLQFLNLEYNNLKDKRIIKLATALNDNNSLVRLNLNHNDISDNGVRALAEMLKTNSILKELLLSHNSIGNSGIVNLGQMIAVNSHLRFINLYKNNISDSGAQKFLEGLKYNTTFDKIILNVNYLSDELFDLIAERTYINRHNKYINSLTLVQILKNHKKIK